MYPTIRLAALAALLALAAACDRSLTDPVVVHANGSAVPGRASPPNRVGSAFNPQPDPPARTIRFRLAGALQEALRGSFTLDGCQAPGSLAATNLVPVVQRGATLHLSQSWSLVSPGPCRGAPLPGGTLTLDGIVNTANGDVLLDGAWGDGTRGHVRGTLEAGAGAPTLVGELTVER